MYAIIIFLALVPPGPPIEKPKPPPEGILPTKCCWGGVSVIGTSVFIKGHSDWTADGGFLKNKTAIYLWWKYLPTGRIAVSLYSYSPEERQWIGEWGWADEARIEQDQIMGNVHREVLRKE